MQDLILYIVKNLVTNPDAVSVEEQSNGGQVDLLLTVDPADMGLVIGKGGQTIKAIRKVLIVKAMADNVRVNLQLAEPAGGRPERSADQQVSESAESVSKETLPSSSEESQPSSEPENTATDTPTSADTAETPKAKKAKKTKEETATTPEEIAEKAAEDPLLPAEPAEEHAEVIAEQD